MSEDGDGSPATSAGSTGPNVDREDHSLQSSPTDGAVPSAGGLLLTRIRAGDVGAGHQFVREYYAGVYRYVLYLTGSPEAAEDLTQETFLQAWRRLETFDGRAALRTWLHRIAHREFLQALRSQRRVPGCSLQLGDQAVVSLAAVGEIPDLYSAGLTEAIELRMIISKLPMEERQIVVLHYLEGYQHEEVAHILGIPLRRVRQRLVEARGRLQQELAEGDLLYLNEPSVPMRHWAWLPLDQIYTLATRLTRAEAAAGGTPRPGAATEESMERREFLRHAAASAAVLMLPETEKEVVDSRLTKRGALAFKGTALSDLCEHLRADTGVRLAAGPSVADEKVTLFCPELPLREVMRQLSRPFGYAWLRSGAAGQYRYELVQDLRSQLLEEELRNRDRNESLLALERELQRYRPYLTLSPDEALERAKTAPPGEKELLERLSGPRWGVIQMIARLSSQDMALLRAGQELYFCEAPKAGEAPLPAGQRVLPPEIGRGVLQSMRDWRLIKSRNEEGVEGYGFSPDRTAPGALAPAAIPTCRAGVTLRLNESELGRVQLGGISHLNSIGSNGQQYNDLQEYHGDCATGISPTVLSPNNAALNARLARDPALQHQVTVVPGGTREAGGGSGADQRAAPAAETPDPIESSVGALASPKVTSADVLEALHRATGLPIVADFYTRLDKPEDVSVRHVPLFDALNRLADTMRLRWHKDGEWLQFRSTSFYDDRLKEVPNRLLNRWVASRREHGALTLDDLCEIAELRDVQLDGGDMAEGAREYLGLAEWDVACAGLLRPHLRFLASLTPSQRQEATTAAGLLLTRMSLSQQQQFIALGVRGGPLQSLNDLAGATLRVSYTRPGAFQWGEAGGSGFYTRWVVPLGPGPRDQRVPRPPIVARTREQALAAVQRVDPRIREALLQAVRLADPRIDGDLSSFEAQQVFPTQLDLWFVYVPGSTSERPIFVVGRGIKGQRDYRQR
jgi:RNA polymerase sigma-70 factor (ECF subfamily)